MKVSDPRTQAAPQEKPPKVDRPLEGLRILGRIDRKHRMLRLKRPAAAARRRRAVELSLAWTKRLLPWTKRLATLAIMLVGILMALVIWDYYVASPWTRDGSVRVQVARVAPQVSGQITELRVADNQFVHKGDVLYVIDPFDFRVALQSNKAKLQQKAADLQVKQLQSDRRQHLSIIATTAEQQQVFAGTAIQAKPPLEAASQLLDRTHD